MARNKLSPSEQAALAFWPQIEFAARNHLPTQQLWDAIRSAASELGLESPGVTVQGVSGLRARAVAIQRAETQLAARTDERRLLGRDVSQAPWSRSLGEQRALPKFQVRFQHTFTQAGLAVTEWRTSLFEGKLPRTVGELRSLIDQDALQMANKYNVTHVGIDSLQLLAI